MKLNICKGHSTPYNGGANGIRSEEYLIDLIVPKLIDGLKSLGNEVNDITPSEHQKQFIKCLSDSLRIRCDNANNNLADLNVFIHFNCYNGRANGTEVCYVSNAGKVYADTVCKNISRLGYNNRGSKKRTNLYVLKRTVKPSILIECCFCDNKYDMELFNVDEMVNAIILGLVGKLPYQKEYKPKYNANICLLFQQFYNTLTKRPLKEDGVFGKETEKALNSINKILEDFR